MGHLRLIGCAVTITLVTISMLHRVARKFSGFSGAPSTRHLTPGHWQDKPCLQGFNPVNNDSQIFRGGYFGTTDNRPEISYLGRFGLSMVMT
jgi:hypothetical protein